MAGIFLSIIFPGLGQIYFGKTAKGVLMMILALIPFLYVFVLIWSVVDSVKLYPAESGDKLSIRDGLLAGILLFIITPLSLYFLFSGFLMAKDKIQKDYLAPRNTTHELRNIQQKFDAYFYQHNRFPESYTDFINSKPIWNSWKSDSWGNSYQYMLIDSLNYKLISAGKDGVFNTTDDLFITNK